MRYPLLSTRKGKAFQSDIGVLYFRIRFTNLIADVWKHPIRYETIVCQVCHDETIGSRLADRPRMAVINLRQDVYIVRIYVLRIRRISVCDFPALLEVQGFNIDKT